MKNPILVLGVCEFGVSSDSYQKIDERFLIYEDGDFQRVVVGNHDKFLGNKGYGIPGAETFQKDENPEVEVDYWYGAEPIPLTKEQKIALKKALSKGLPREFYLPTYGGIMTISLELEA